MLSLACSDGKPGVVLVYGNGQGVGAYLALIIKS